MLQITIKGGELWNSKTEEFLYSEGETVLLEHNLLAIAKWESKWKVPFLGMGEKTPEQFIDYCRCMCVTPPNNPFIFYFLSKKQRAAIEKYIAENKTAATFGETGYHNPGENTTSETIYYWMVECGIPFECEKWHLSRLLALIRFCSEKRKPPKKMSEREIAAQYRAQNKRRKQAMKH